MLNQDQQAILLLTAHFGGSTKDDPKPLGPKEWGEFAQWLKGTGHRPGELVNGSVKELLSGWSHRKISVDRLQFLLARGSSMALAVEKWERAGIWILTRGDAHYPLRLKQRLGAAAPPVFFGCGNQRLLGQGGVAFVGSRKATDEDLNFTREASKSVAIGGYSVISGGARGVDETAMLAALEAEGTVVGVLADSLLRAASSSKYRPGLRSGDLALISPYQPEARFLVGNAMGRNKYIYCLADAGVVVTCEEGQGGTWSGAREAIKNAWVPVWARHTRRSADGVIALEAMGAKRLPDGKFDVVKLFKAPSDSDDTQAAESESLVEPEATLVHVKSEEPALYESPEQKLSPDSGEALFRFFLGQLRPMTQADPQKPGEIAEQTGLELSQVKAWLLKAKKAGLVEQASKSPIRYQWVSQGSLVLDSDST